MAEGFRLFKQFKGIPAPNLGCRSIFCYSVWERIWLIFFAYDSHQTITKTKQCIMQTLFIYFFIWDNEREQKKETSLFWYTVCFPLLKQKETNTTETEHQLM